MPSLMDLKRATRDRIAELVLLHNDPLAVPGSYPPWHAQPSSVQTLERNHLALTQVSRKLRKETTPIFYARNTFAICLQPVCVDAWALLDTGDEHLVRRRSYGDYASAQFCNAITGRAIYEVRTLRVDVGCVRHWKGDQAAMERGKCEEYGVTELNANTKEMTEHLLLDMCCSRDRFWEVELEGRNLEPYDEFDTPDEECATTSLRDDEEKEEICDVCQEHLKQWMGSLNVFDGKMRLIKGSMMDLLWPSGLERTSNSANAHVRADARI